MAICSFTFTLISLLVEMEIVMGALPVASAQYSTTTYSYSSFTYTQQSSNQYATPLPSPLRYPTPLAPPFEKVSSLLPANVTYTTYSLRPEATSTNDGAYGQSAYAALWRSSNLTFTKPPPFTVTVLPTPVARTELVLPPVLYNAPDISTTSKLPADFIWGVAGSAFQIEGGLQIEGRGPSLQDSAGVFDGGQDGNDASMNYFLYKQDIARLAAIGLPYYSFTISWTRVVPFGRANTPINQQALDHYDDLINTCIQYGVTPIVTLAHFDYPIDVDINQDSLREHFLYYAKQVMARYSDRVPIWFTFNEPNIGVGATPGRSWNSLTYIMLAHADVYHWYKHELNGTGKISMKFASNLIVPLDLSNSDDVQSSLRSMEFSFGSLGIPLFMGTQYPAAVLNSTNLVALTDDQIAHVNNTMDFLGFDAYTAQFGEAPPGGLESCISDPTNPHYPTCAILSNVQANGWAMGLRSNSYPYIAPQYVRQQFGYIWNTFRPHAVMLCEFGFPVYQESFRDLVDQRYDLDRSLYYQDYLAEMLKAKYEDGVNVIGALAWSFVDNNEFGSYEQQFGMQAVNRTGSFERTYRRSFFDYVDFFHQHVAQS
jgi:beta-glucosidase/6-phospho-beta-glucosidase/beta-galactosidase